MELLCPECMGVLTIADGKSARCTVHGGEYQVLFSHWQPAPLPPVIALPEGMSFQLTPGTMCYQHRSMPAAFVCEDCGTPVCDVCVFEQSDGRKLCPQCVARGVESGAEGPAAIAVALPAGVHCVQHPNLPATQKCRACGAFMCATCDFILPGDIHVCPACAAAPKTTLSPRRKRLLIGSFALAAFSTVGMALIMSGAFAELGRTKGGETALGYLFSILVLVPALVGMSLGFSVIDRRLSSPISVWIAAIWNIVMIAAFLLLAVIGIMM